MVRIMRRVKIDYKPPEIFLIRMLAALIWVLVFFLGMKLCGGSMRLMAIFSFAFWLPTLAAGLICFGFKKTVVMYDEKSISWRWLWLNYSIDMTNIKSFSHAIKWNPVHSGREYWAEIRFRNGNDENDNNYVCLRALAAYGYHEMGNIIFQDEVIKEIYDFYAKLYPEKAKGEVKYDKYCI